MSNNDTKRIHIPEICRVEGHSAVDVEIEGGQVKKVQLEVFEGTRFFEKIVVGHQFEEMPHITSRICAICSTGHVLAAIFALERALAVSPSETVQLLRELMHLGMIIESHATHIYALALPDFVGASDLVDFASKHANEFEIWNSLRNLGATIQTVLGGRPFHPVNLHVGGFSRYPTVEQLKALLTQLSECLPLALKTCDLLLSFKPPVARTTTPTFLALVPADNEYGYFGRVVRSSDGWEDSIQNYREYLGEQSVPYSHAKRSSARGKPLMVGSMARLALFGHRLGRRAGQIFHSCPLSKGDTNTLWNNLAQGIEVVDAIDRAELIIEKLITKLTANAETGGVQPVSTRAADAVGAVECPRGTLYHSYSLNERGQILAADMVTPSAQNTARIELDIKEVVSQAADPESAQLRANLETLVRAYDPCNTCATHMVSVRYV
jgi:sulfhydrogenase subunit alpha